MTKTIIACDPGLSGGIAWTFGGNCAVDKMPKTEPDIHELIRRIQRDSFDRPVICYIEDVPVSMGNRGTASVKLNANAAYIRGVVNALNIRLVMVRPAKWQQHFSLGTRKSCASDTQWKNKLKQAAQRLYPDIKVTLDTSDALLLLEYGRVQP